MRIAVFTESYEPIVNGVSVAVATLRDGLRARGHEVHVFAPRYPGHVDASGVLRFPSRASRLSQGYPVPSPVAPAVKREFFRLQFDIVHTQTPFVLGVVGLRWGRAAGIPVVSTNHTIYTEYAHYLPLVPRGLTKAMIIRTMKSYYSRCDAVVVPSLPVEKILRGYGIETPMEVIKSGVSVTNTHSRREAREALGIREDAFLLLYVGRVAREKNLSLLLKAFKAVRDQHPEARLMIVGAGPYEKASHDLAADLGVLTGVTFAGMLGRADVDVAYHAADLFAFPSMTETQGLVLCEALSAGLPCVAVRAAGTPEVVEDGVGGILTENSVEEFAQVISRLISDPDLRASLAAGAIKNSERFTIQSMIERFESFYTRAIERKNQ